MRAGIYARISKDTEGTELGVTRQQDDCLREAERRDWEVVERYVDNDVSATRTKVRPEYRRMLRDIETRHIDAVVVWAVDRLTRTPRELEDIIDLAGKHGVEFANVSGTINLGTPEGRAMARQMGTFARLEVENMSKRLKRKFQEKAEIGEPHGYSPYGFTRVDRRDVKDQFEAEIIEECAKRVLQHESLRSIITDLNRRSVPCPADSARRKLAKARGKPIADVMLGRWNTTILRQIMLRPSNAGLRQYQGEVMGKATTEPIYDEVTYDRLVSLLRDPSRRSNHVGPGYKYLLSGIAVCGRCGGAMRRQIGRTVTSKRTGKTKRQPPSYCCSVCFKVRRKQEEVDYLVAAVIVGRLSRPDAIDMFALSDTASAKEAQQVMDSIDAKLDLAADQFTDDAITAPQLKRITARLRAERARAETRYRAAHPRSAVANLAGGDVQAKWDSMPIGARREVVEALMTVTIQPSGSGRKFDPESVTIDWLERVSEAT